MRNMHSKFFLSFFGLLSFCLASLLFCSAADAAAALKQYVVLDRIAPVFESLSETKNPPKGGWKVLSNEACMADVVVYGDVVGGVPASKKGWILLKSDGKNLGYIQERALTPFPAHKKRTASPFQVI